MSLKAWLAPPGEGVYTVNTGKEKRQRLQRALYGDEDVRSAWERSLGNTLQQPVALLGIPSDNGGGIHRGANWGPLAVREALLHDGTLFPDLGDVRVIPHLLHDKYLNAETLRACREALYGNASKDWPVAPLSIAEAALTEIYRHNQKLKVLGIGGDHSVSYPLVRAWAKSRAHSHIALLHFDAHTDLLDARLGIDLCFGTWTYHVRDLFPSAAQLVQVGIRSTGKERGHWEGLGLTQLWAQEVHERGARQIAQRIIDLYRSAGIKEVYLSFDIDALDARWASATGTPEAQGLDPIVCQEIIQAVAEAFPVTGADLMEVAPYVNFNPRPNNEQAQSLTVAAAMARALVRALGVHA